jgi:dual specificity protein kinase YAK1
MPDANDQFDLPRWHTAHSPALLVPAAEQHAGLARSASFAGASSSQRNRRHSFLTADSDSHTMQPQSAFYPPPPHFPTQPPPNSAPSESFPDIYYPKRIPPAVETASSRSPMRMQTTPLLDPYSPQQAQYSPSTQYQYPAQAQQQFAHNRSISHPKHEPLTPPVSQSYASPPSAHPGSSYAPSSTSYVPPFAMDTSSPHPSPQAQAHLAAQPSSRTHSHSNPSTPISYVHGPHAPNTQYYAPESQMVVDPPPKRRVSGFRRVRTAHDLQPRVENNSAGRRVTADGIYLSVRPHCPFPNESLSSILQPLRQLTTNLVETYHICNPQFRYESAHNPRRVLTKPSKPAHNDGYDNEDYDYVLYVNDWLGTEEGHKSVLDFYHARQVNNLAFQVLDSRYPRSRHLWTGGKVPKYENT